MTHCIRLELQQRKRGCARRRISSAESLAPQAIGNVFEDRQVRNSA
jgi:hypothetical protein